MKTSKDTMMLIKEPDQSFSAGTFKLIPMSLTSPFVEIRFSTQEKLLMIISKIGIEQFQVFPKLDSNGNPKKSSVNKEGVCFERHKVSSFYDFNITDKQDIIDIVTHLDGSVSPQDLDKYFIKDKSVDPNPPTTESDRYEKVDLQKLDSIGE